MRVLVRVVETRTSFVTYEVEADSVITASREFGSAADGEYVVVDRRLVSNSEDVAAAADKTYLIDTNRVELFKSGDD